MALEIQVKGLFATPVAAVVLPDAETRNAELKEIILRRRAEHPSVGASNMGGWHSSRDLAEWGGKRAEEVLAFGRDLATKLTADRDGRAVRPEWKTEAWANVNGPGDFECLPLSSGFILVRHLLCQRRRLRHGPNARRGIRDVRPPWTGADDACPGAEIQRRGRTVGRQCGNHSSASRTAVSVSVVPAARGATLSRQRFAHLHRFQFWALSGSLRSRQVS